MRNIIIKFKWTVFLLIATSLLVGITLPFALKSETIFIEVFSQPMTLAQKYPNVKPPENPEARRKKWFKEKYRGKASGEISTSDTKKYEKRYPVDYIEISKSPEEISTTIYFKNLEDVISSFFPDCVFSSK